MHPTTSKSAFSPRLVLLPWACLVLAAVSCGPADAPGGRPELVPIDPQVVQDQDDMAWEDYRPIPGIRWADTSMAPERGFKLAVVAIDFPDQPFVITQPRGSDPFGNPQVDPIAREDVARFYADFFTKPGELNHGQTIHGYWMEQSRGRFGITEVDVFGPFRMPESLWKYGLNEYGQETSTPDGSEADRRMERDVDSIWIADVGGDPREEYDAILRVYAGYDETSVWQEFGEMKFSSREDIPPEWGNPNPDMPRWIPTRYVEWTSWLAGAQQWGLSSMRQGESSGTITHELGHFAFRLPDLNNNPYVEPYRRVAAGTWDMMDRGSFNGPGGPHMRWVVPPIRGAAMPAGLMLRNRMATEFVAEEEVLTLSREGLASSGLVVARVTARAVKPLPGTFAGIVVRLDGDEPRDRTPPSDPSTDPLSPGELPYDFYSLEVVQRIGYDSFTPDNGVLLAMNRDQLRGNNGGPNGFNSYIWVIDAHPEDMNAVDFVRPNGERVMRTVADYRQLNDALFHAGLDSGSEFEWRDPHNGLHFYMVDLERGGDGILSYTLGVRSLEGSGLHERGVDVVGPRGAGAGVGEGGGSEGSAGSVAVTEPLTPLTFTVTNTGAAGALEPGLHLDDASAYLRADIFRLSVAVEGEGWSARLQNALMAVEAGGSAEVTVYVTREGAGAAGATVTLRAVSESDLSRAAEAAVRVSG
jgi:M6 family metalloprotease-like protein